VVWVKRWALDTRDEIDGAGMVDPRVTHLWDAANLIGEGFLERFGVDFGGLDYGLLSAVRPRRHLDPAPTPTGWGGRAGVGGLRCEHPR
jgi:hypothetical protein